MEGLWATLLQNKPKADQERYYEAIKLIQLEGFTYSPMSALLESKIEELTGRLETFEQGAPLKKEPEALLGAIPAPADKLTLSEALQHYYEFTQKELLRKRPDQTRRWRNIRESTVKNFIQVIGENKQIQEITRADARRFRDWWLKRLQDEGLSRDSFNKQIGLLSRIFNVVNEEMALGLEPIFSKLSLRKGTNLRPPFSRVDVEEVLLSPGFLSYLISTLKSALHF